MKLQVKNFGPIREAEVELKPLTVFVGHGNTGKSYLAMLLYSIAKTLDNAHQHIVWSLDLHFREASHKLQMPWNKVIEDGKIFSPIVAEAMAVFARTFRGVWALEAQRCFGEEWETIVKSNGKWPVSIVIESDKGVVLDLLNPKNDKHLNAAKVVRYIQTTLKEMDDARATRARSVEMPRSLDERGCAAIICGVMWLLPELPFSFSDASRVHYLPAIRSGTMQRHRMMVSAIIGNAADISIFGRNLGESLNGVLADFLQKLVLVGSDKRRVLGDPNGVLTDFLQKLVLVGNDKRRVLGDPKRRRTNGKTGNEAGKLSRAIEQEILKGEIVEETSETGYTDFRYKFASHGKERNIQLMNASSSVSELAPIVIFMRHYLEPPGDIFIVEEPEAHLHPDDQRRIAGVLAGLVKAGVNVVITTHSDMILEQLSNFVHAHGVPKVNLLNEKSGERTISEEQTAVYSFTASAPRKETVVRKIKFNEDTGMVTEDHLDASSAMYDETVHIFKRKQRMSNDA